MSYWFRQDKALIAGDALAIQNGELGIANPEYTLDMEGAVKSVSRLLDYDIEKIICYHGGVYKNGIRESLEGILSKFNRVVDN